MVLPYGVCGVMEAAGVVSLEKLAFDPRIDSNPGMLPISCLLIGNPAESYAVMLD